MSDETTERVAAVNRGVEQSGEAAPKPGAPHRALDAWIGRWINQGYTVDEHGGAGLPITTSDGDTWTYHGDTTRATVRFSHGDTVQTVLDERTDDGSTFVPSMKVTLIKVP